MTFRQIRDQVPILGYLEQRLQWHHVRASGGRRGECPICQHRKGKPFWVDVVSQRFFCHKCKRKGDVIDLHCMIHGIFLTVAATELVNAGPYSSTCRRT